MGTLPSALTVFLGIFEKKALILEQPVGRGSKPMVPIWGRCTTHFRTYFNGDWDVHWGLCG